VAADGSLAGRFVASDDALIPVPEGAEDVMAAAFGQVGLAAWMPLTWLAPVRPGEVVLVLGATGSVGSVAVQAAKLLGAGHVVGVGRDQSRLDVAGGLGADAVVALDGDDFRPPRRGAGRRTAVTRHRPLGPPLEAAAAVAGLGEDRSLGQSAGPVAALASGLVRGKQLQILGYSNFAVPQMRSRRGMRRS
jgi:NADPH2:quinone reductase